MDIEFGYRFCTLIDPKSRRVSTIQLITALEMIASLSVDAKWLSWLKYQFQEAMKQNSRITPGECRLTFNDFYNSFSFKEKFLAQRLFDYLDVDKSGFLTLHEFINGLEIVVNGNEQEKMEFLFKVFDVDSDGRLDYHELRMLLKCCLEDSPSLDIEEAVDDLTAYFFRDTDIDDSGDITLEELKEAFLKHDGLYKSLSISTSIWIKPKYTNQRKRMNFIQKLKETIENQRGLLVFWCFYILVHILTAVNAYLNYSHKGPWIICARIFGNGLNFNCALVLTLVLRKHFTWLRAKGAHSFLPLDNNIDLHKIIGIIILIETLIHTLAHFGYLYFVEFKINGNSFWNMLFTLQKSIGYPSGVLELFILCLILMFTFSCVRRRGHFQLFYIFHLLALPWLLIMLIHGKQFWKWLLIPGTLYAIERILRYRKTKSHKLGDTYISEAILLPSKVTHLVIKRPERFNYKAGDYIYINIPAIAKYEWHPFSISSVPECEDSIWLHIRAAGNWTNKLNTFVRERLSSKFVDESVLRTSMRSRMSRILSDVNSVKQYATSHKRVSWNANKIILGMNVSSENNNVFYLNNFKTYDTNKINYLKNVADNTTTNCSFKQPTIPPPPIPGHSTMNNTTNTHRKGILKSISKDHANFKSIGSEFGEMTGDIQAESTPKADLSKISEQFDTSEQQQHQQKEQLQKQQSQQSNTLSINLNAIANMNTDDLEKYMKSLLEEKKSNISRELEKYQRENSVAIELEESRENNRKLSINNESDTQPNEFAKENYHQVLKQALSIEQQQQLENDALGYLKMYKKTNRLVYQQMPLSEQWRLQVYIDGPYGTPSQDIFEGEHVILIAAGIGITPFASILQSIMQRFKRTKNQCPQCDHQWEEECNDQAHKSSIKKVDFIWVTRDQRSLEWFISMLSQMEIDQKKNNFNFLETHLYVTSAKRQTDLKNIGLHMTLDVIYSEENAKHIEGLKERTHYGRPNWDIVFQQLIRKQQGKISVFFCGPPNLSNVLQRKCKEYNLTYKKELF